MRNSPIPSAPASAAVRASAGAPTFASTPTGRPSAVAPVPFHSAGPELAAATGGASGSTARTDPASPSTATAVASNASAPRTATTAGIPSERARIAV